MNFFDHKDLGNHLLQLCPKVVKHSVYPSQHFPSGAASVCQAGNFWTLLRTYALVGTIVPTDDDKRINCYIAALLLLPVSHLFRNVTSNGSIVQAHGDDERKL